MCFLLNINHCKQTMFYRLKMRLQSCSCYGMTKSVFTVNWKWTLTNTKGTFFSYYQLPLKFLSASTNYRSNKTVTRFICGTHQSMCCKFPKMSLNGRGFFYYFFFLWTDGVGKATRYTGPPADSFPVPTYLFLNAIKDWGRMRRGLLGRVVQCVLVKTASGATGNESGE